MSQPEGAVTDVPRALEASTVLSTRPEPPCPARFRGERTLLALLLILALGFRVWHLERNGFGHPYYAAAVRSMLVSWHNFFFDSFDPAGYLTVDKPPVTFWIQATAARILGFGGLVLHLPQALEGTAAVLLLYLIVRSNFGPGAGLLAGLILAVMPINVAADRSNLPDSCLVFFLLLAAWSFSKAMQTGRLWHLLLSVILVGVAFNVKLMAAFVILPTLYGVYFLGAPISWVRRLTYLTAAIPVLAMVALSWSVAVDLTPPDQRPYVGDTQDNSMMTMAIGTSGPFSGIGRVLSARRPGGPSGARGPGGGFPGGQGRPMPGQVFPPGGGMAPPGMGPFGAGPPGGGPGGPRGRGQQIGYAGPPGPFRLVEKNMAEQFAWFLPFALVGIPLASVSARRDPHPRRQRMALLMWVGWLASYAIVLSFMRGVVHNYYLVLISPALAALAGVGLVAMWRWYAHRPWTGSLLLCLAVAATVSWHLFILRNHADWRGWIQPLLIGGATLAVFALLTVRLFLENSPGGHRMAYAGGMLVMLLCPTLWSLTPVLGRGHPALPMAYPELVKGEGIPPQLTATPDNGKLIEYLHAHSHGERYLLMTPEIHSAAPLIIETGEPVVAIGGFTGSDPTITAERFAQLVADGQVRFVMIGRMPDGRRQGIGAVFEWVRDNGRLVPAALWRDTQSDDARPRDPRGANNGFDRPQRRGSDRYQARGGPGGFNSPAGGPAFRGRGPGGPMDLFDCRPDAALDR